MTVYRGLVIGGYYDGKVETSHVEYLTLHKPFYVDDYPSEISLADALPINDLETYRHVNFHYRSDRDEQWKYGFWVPHNIVAAQPYILEKLIEKYQK